MENLGVPTTFCWRCHRWFPLDEVSQLIDQEQITPFGRLIGRFCSRCGPLVHQELLDSNLVFNFVWKSM
jgi:hypothetical protein